MEEAISKEQQLVKQFQGLSLAETVVKLRGIRVRAEVEDGLVVLTHPILPSDYRRQYPDTLILIKGTKE